MPRRFYEFWTAIDANKHLPVWKGFAIAATIAIILPAMLLASAGAVFSTPLLGPAASEAGPIKRARRWIGHYKVFSVSAILVVAAAFILTSAHFAIG